MTGAKPPKISIMVSSTVYDIRSILGQVHGILNTYGYDVWMSDASGIPVDPEGHNFESCIAAVEKCDVFFGIITPSYGTGVSKKENKSITHLELLRAIELDKPRFMLCHETVTSARVLLNTLECDGHSLKGAAGRQHLSLKSKSVLKDLRVIDMLEAALREDIADADERTNHWVQEFENETQVKTYVKTQFEPDGRNVDFINKLLERKRSAAPKKRPKGKGKP